MAARLGLILSGLTLVVERARPDEVAVEPVFSCASPRSVLVLGQARGVALAVSARAGLPVHEYAPPQVKQAFTGSGRAGKDQMMRTAQALLGVAAELSDEADAIALAVCHLARRPLAAAASATSRAAAARALSRLRPSRRDHRKAP